MSYYIRYHSIDIWRGCAISLMIGYHFCFDLNNFQIVTLDFYRDPFWLGARTFIVSLFLFLVGISLELSARRGLANKDFRRSFSRRLAGVFLCAVLVSLVSYWIYPPRWIFFGILHFITVASVIGLLFVGRPAWSLSVGLLLICAGILLVIPAFDHPGLQWLGLMTHKPQTEDYVPLLPWLGIVLLGMASCARCFNGATVTAPASAYQGRQPLRILAWAGRHGLLIYMLHQPILLAVLMIITGRSAV